MVVFVLAFQRSRNEFNEWNSQDIYIYESSSLPQILQSKDKTYQFSGLFWVISIHSRSWSYILVYQLEDLLDRNSVDVDWRRSFYLNLIAHTSFSVTVAICRYVSLRFSRSTYLSFQYKHLILLLCVFCFASFFKWSSPFPCLLHFSW